MLVQKPLRYKSERSVKASIIGVYSELKIITRFKTDLHSRIENSSVTSCKRAVTRLTRRWCSSLIAMQIFSSNTSPNRRNVKYLLKLRTPQDPSSMFIAHPILYTVMTSASRQRAFVWCQKAFLFINSKARFCFPKVILLALFATQDSQTGFLFCLV